MSEKKPSPRPARLPLLAVRDVVVFPHMVLPLSVGRPKSVKAIEAAMQTEKFLVVVAQKDVGVEDPKAEDVYRMGVLVEVVQYLKMPDGTLKEYPELSMPANSGSGSTNGSGASLGGCESGGGGAMGSGTGFSGCP
jgi:ATP-dependent Lon protease